MPTYEIALLLKPLSKPELAAALKRTATAILNEGGVIRKMDNLGVKPTPYKLSSHGATHKQAHYFIISMIIGKHSRESLVETCKLDIDIIRSRFVWRGVMRVEPKPTEECTLYEDLLPPPYRPSVQEMIAQGERRLKPKYQYKSGMDYYPFQR